MLQIISGKFFKGKDRHTHQGRGILYSNFSWVAPIETTVGVLEPVDTYYRVVASYVYSYTNQIEDTGPGFTIVRVGDSDIVNHFKLLCMFGLRAYFAEDRAQVEHICRAGSKMSSDAFVPSQFIPRIFSPNIQGDFDEIAKFPAFVKKVISMRRKQYLAIMECLKNMNHALEVLSYNVDLSYSMLVYCLESLSQGFDEFTPEWNHYEEKVRAAIDLHLQGVDVSIGDNIRSALLEASHVQLQTRFLDFITKHVTDAFFTDEAKDVRGAVRPSQIRQALKNAYVLRSKYVHTLQKIQDHLRHSKLSDSDVFIWDNEVYLTLGGLYRVVRHVIHRFIQLAESVESEEYNWLKDLPGQVQMKLAPQYWIWKHDDVTFPMKQDVLGPSVTSKFWGFASHLLTLRGSGSLPDLRELLKKYEKLLPNSNAENKLRMLCTYRLFNSILTPNDRSENFEKVIAKYAEDCKVCSLENIFCEFYLTKQLPWKFKEIEKVYAQFSARRFSSKAALLPRDFELALLLKLASMALDEGNEEEFIRITKAANLEAAGMPNVQALLQKHLVDKTAVDNHIIYDLLMGADVTLPNDMAGSAPSNASSSTASASTATERPPASTVTHSPLSEGSLKSSQDDNRSATLPVEECSQTGESQPHESGTVPQVQAVNETPHSKPTELGQAMPTQTQTEAGSPCQATESPAAVEPTDNEKLNS